MSEIVAKRMKEIRTYYKLNQKEFCAEIELSPSRLSDIEAGNTNPSFNTLLAISNRFSISLDWLVAGKGDMFFKQQKENIDARLHSDEAQLIQQYRKLTERQKGRIDQQVDNFVDENKRSSHFAQSDDEMIQNLA